MFGNYCKKVQKFYELEAEIKGIESSPAAKSDLKADLEKFFDEKRSKANDVFAKVAQNLDGKRLGANSFRNIPFFNAAALKKIPGYQDQIDLDILSGIMADQLKALLFSQLDKSVGKWGYTSAERVQKIAERRREMDALKKELSFSFKRIGKNKFWPNSRLNESGQDQWLIDAGGPAGKPDIAAVWGWMRSQKDKNILSKAINKIKSI